MPADPKALQAKYQPKSFKVLNTNQQLCSIRFSPDGKLLAGGTFEGSIRRWDFSSDKFDELAPIKGLNGWVQAIAFSADSKRLYSADSWGTLSAWPIDEKEPNPLWIVKGAHDGWIHGLSLSADGTKIATCGRDQTVRVSSTGDGKKEAVFAHPDIVLSVAFHPDGKSIVSGDLKGVIRQCDMVSGKAVREFDAKAMYLKDRIQDVGGVRCFTFNKDGSILIAGGSQPKTGGFVTGSNLILVFDWQSGKVKLTIKSTNANENEGYVNDMSLHPDGFLMSVSSGQPGNGKLVFHSLDDGQAFVTMPLPNCHSLALHPSASRLVVSATNANSSGNGRVGTKENYPGNFSPLHVLDFPKPKS